MHVEYGSLTRAQRPAADWVARACSTKAPSRRLVDPIAKSAEGPASASADGEAPEETVQHAFRDPRTVLPMLERLMCVASQSLIR